MSVIALEPSAPAAVPQRGSLDPAIHTQGLSKRYGNTLALDALDLTVGRGEVYGYLGPNGSGKTTTIRLLLGLHRPTAGQAQLFGHDAWRDPVAAHRHVAYVAGEPFLWPGLTSAETFEFLARLHGGVDATYRELLVQRFQLDPHKKIRALSKGNRQKVQLIAALASRAELLLLDEPTSGLDPLMEIAFRDCIEEAKERGRAVFLSSHILSEAEALCDRVGILREGRLVDEGTLAQLRHLAAQTVEVTFAGHAPTLPPLPGVQVQNAGPSALRFEVSGSVGPLIAALAGVGGHSIQKLTSREPSLEEIFIHHYDGFTGRGGE
jgi:ABC-2 type transport system ATP-binding protein